MTFINPTTGQERTTPPTEGELPDGRTVSGITPTNTTMLAACGWHPVTDTPRPDDTDTTTHDRTLTSVDGVWVEQWTPRPWTDDELTARNTPAPQSDADRIAALEAQNAELLAKLATATTLAQVRAAAQAAAD